MSRIQCETMKTLAALTVRNNQLETSTKGVKYDPNTGIVTIENPNNLYSIVPIITDISLEASEHYITTTHFIRQLSSEGLTNQFRVWMTDLSTGARNWAPTNFSVIVVGIK